MNKTIIVTIFTMLFMNNASSETVNIGKIDSPMHTAIRRGLSYNNSVCFEHVYQSIPKRERRNWTMTFDEQRLNNYEDIIFNKKGQSSYLVCTNGRLLRKDAYGFKQLNDYSDKGDKK